MIGKGLPDILAFNRMTQTTGQLKSRLSTVSQEAVTGMRSDIPGSIGVKIGEANIIKKALADIEQRENLYTVVDTRISQMSTALAGVREASADVGTYLLGDLESPDGTILRSAATEASVALESVFSMLNASQGGRTLFSGGATQERPLAGVDQLLADVGAIMSSSSDPAAVEAALDTYFNDPAGGFATTIYQGDDGSSGIVRMADGGRIDYTVRANEQALRDTIRGLAVVATATESPMGKPSEAFSTLIRDELGAMENGRMQILDLETRLGIVQEQVERARGADTSERQVLSAVYQTLVGRDQYEAANELKQIEIQLEASYLITSRLSSLNFTNFIR